MNILRRKFLQMTAGAATMSAFPCAAEAAAYPSRPVRIVVGLPPGLAPDIVTRLVATSLAERLGQPVVVENRVGAAGNVGAEYVVRSAPDGYTLFTAVSGNAINTSLYSNLSFDFTRDLEPVALLGLTPFVMVASPSVTARTLPEFIAYAKANPGKINMASPGSGTAPHLSGELLKMMAGLDMAHVPYRTNYISDLIGGQVQVAFIAAAPVRGYIEGGQLRALGVTSMRRMEALPDVPTISETVPGYEGSGWIAVCAPKRTPSDIVNRLNREISTVSFEPDIKKKLLGFGVEHAPLMPSQVGELFASATEKWAKVIKFAGVRAE
jgi:tripartite-type tricarboxylate transporter receptor subunit TctC